MGRSSRAEQKDRYAAVIDQDEVTDEIRDIALRYDPLNQGGRREGFHLSDDGELHIDDEKVIEEHRIVQNKIPSDAIRIVRLPAERGQLVHQYGPNGFRLYELPAPAEGSVVGVLGPNGVGKTTALRILAGALRPNLGRVDDPPDWDEVVREFRGTAVQNYLETLRDEGVRAAYKPQQVGELADRYDGTVRELLAERDDRDPGDDRDAQDERGAHDAADRGEQSVRERVVDRLDLGELLDRPVDALSGGELQRAAIAATAVADADVYLFDEPSSYLDVGQRLAAARALRELAADARVLVVEHDLVTLDVVADDVNVLYGEPGGFGVVSRPLSVRRGINQFLEGFLEGENVRIRPDAVEFLRRSDRPDVEREPVVRYPALAKSFDSFSLRVEPGTIREGEVVGVLGRNGLGKTTFAKLLAGELDPDPDSDAGSDRAFDADVQVAYKPQYLDPAFEGTVRGLFEREVDVRAPGFDAEIRRPFNLDPIFDREVETLSGGELQRVGVALALARDADLYLLDEPSAYLDVDRRTALATAIRRYVEHTGSPCLVVDHDLLVLDYVADRAVVFEGEPGNEGAAASPHPVREGLDRFLATVGVTFRRDPDTGRPRANKPGSQKDREQKRAGNYYAV